MPNSFKVQAEKFKANGLPKNYNVEIVLIDNNPIGFIGTTMISNDTLYLTALYILNEHQRKGYGGLVLNIIQNRCIKCKIKKVILRVHKYAKWATNFYLANGFKIIEKEKINDLKIIDNTVAMSKTINIL
ncbi:GNAT family N-acetyltransferase [Clostridium sp. D2Q-14]|uniref:GNAT family N-acetyltransferase n=1 Tax=Anaeromonas gelatinilytica TaxID=2683194 RepID=UPI00193B2B79|nr:GNAT family N-acetyltransferase [Anaeromonas gelatinilytica]MBS4535043.1 GNAT family N-acetyltransferase [Anaeromonas gelatinilytica]